MNTSPAAPEPVDPPKRPTRFTYASGARPLEGYTIKRGVGAGGFGEVYFAVSDAGKEVALKLIRRNLEVELRGVKQCLNLKHPNLVALYDIRTDEMDDQWVVMEYVSGASLEDMIERYPEGMPRDMALNWFTGIASAVAYLHDHGIVHRDLKPANIFLDDGCVKIGDYGLSKFISCSRRSGQTESVGTVHYMAPEIANGRYGREIDTYALGIIFYEMLTGHVPFEGESVGEVLMKHLTAEPDLTQLDHPYREIVRGAMAKDPDQRIKSVSEMLAILQADSSLADLAPAATASPFAGFTARTADQPNQHPSAADSPSDDSDVVLEEINERHQTAWQADADDSPYYPADHVEPISAAIRRGWQNTLESVHYHNWSDGQQTAGAVALVLATVFSGAWVVLLALSCVYGMYWVVWALFNPPARSKPRRRRNAERKAKCPPSSDSVVFQAIAEKARAQKTRTEKRPNQYNHKRATTPPWRRRKNQTWKQAAYRELAEQPLRDRISELCGTLLTSALMASACASFISLFAAPQFSPELAVWMSLVATLGSWAVIVLAKFTEGLFEDHTPRRLIQFVTGAGVGLLAWGLAQALLLDLPVSRNFVPGPHDALSGELLGWHTQALRNGYSNGAVSLPLAMFVCNFALMFAGLRWWRQADITRESRISLWSIAVCGAASWLLSLVSWFPQPVGMLTVMATALAVQLSSRWLPPSRRRQLAGEAVTEEVI